MSLINCKVLRFVVMTAAGLFILGLALQLPRLVFAGDFPVLTTLLSGTGLLAMVLSPILMLGIAVLVLLPKVSRSLELCQH
ncbi:MAG: hypothetical protein KDI88_13605 [Gammaproteobacteria bacterium]|nr:hypothetical protein [Gammaproteobacteria bacterium]